MKNKFEQLKVELDKYHVVRVWTLKPQPIKWNVSCLLKWLRRRRLDSYSPASSKFFWKTHQPRYIAWDFRRQICRRLDKCIFGSYRINIGAAGPLHPARQEHGRAFPWENRRSKQIHQVWNNRSKDRLSGRLFLRAPASLWILSRSHRNLSLGCHTLSSPVLRFYMLRKDWLNILKFVWKASQEILRRISVLITFGR